MAKVKRSVLKNLVKECLVEILMEGLYDDEGVEAMTESPRRTKRSRRSSSKGDMLNKIQARKKMLNEKIVTNPEPLPQKAPSDFMGGITNDPVMASIFADTANTTLPQMIGADSASRSGKQGYVPADGAAKMVNENNLEDLFEGSSNWATLAFSSAKKAP
mgnify:CR=1 FL=1